MLMQLPPCSKHLVAYLVAGLSEFLQNILICLFVGSILENSANEFFVGYTSNLNLPTLHLFVTTTEPLPVQFSVTANGFTFSGLASNNMTTVVDLPSTFQVLSNTERNKGIYVKAEGDKRIVLYGLSYSMYTTDAYLALPCSNLAVDEYEYYGITYPSSRWRSDILIVGCEDGTNITTPSTTVTLNRQETYLISSSDSTGMRVTSTKPVSFFSNQLCTNIPSNVTYCDHLTEQIPPSSTWGRSFFAASLLGRSSGEIFRVLTSRSSTCEIEARKLGGGSEVCVSQRGRIFVVTKINERVWPC